MSSNIYNPFLYAWMNDIFQTEFRRVLPCLISRGRITKKQTGASLSLYSVMETRGPRRISLFGSVAVASVLELMKMTNMKKMRNRKTMAKYKQTDEMIQTKGSSISSAGLQTTWRKTDKIWTKWRSSLTPTIHNIRLLATNDRL